jgi:HEPN domain-containing protein
MDSTRRLEARQWLIKAEQDLKVACLLFDTEEEVLSAVVYHCQQAAEKALKAYLTDQGLQFPKTHDLTVLLMLCLPLDKGFEVLQEVAEVLTSYATEFRYPADVMEPERQEAKQAIDLSEETVQQVMAAIDRHDSSNGQSFGG